MEIASIDNYVNGLLDEINRSTDLSSNDLLKAKVAFQLTKIHFGLKLISRVMNLQELQEKIEDRMLNDDNLQDLSMRELLVMSSINTKRVDSYFGKMDKILSSLRLNELEGALLNLAEASAKQKAKALDAPDEGQDSIRKLSLKILNTVSTMKDKLPIDQVPVEIHNEESEDRPRFRMSLDDDDDPEADADNLVNALDSLGDNLGEP